MRILSPPDQAVMGATKKTRRTSSVPTNAVEYKLESTSAMRFRMAVEFSSSHSSVSSSTCRLHVSIHGASAGACTHTDAQYCSCSSACVCVSLSESLRRACASLSCVRAPRSTRAATPCLWAACRWRSALPRTPCARCAAGSCSPRSPAAVAPRLRHRLQCVVRGRCEGRLSVDS
jgi:hypothetical protein